MNKIFQISKNKEWIKITKKPPNDVISNIVTEFGINSLKVNYIKFLANCIEYNLDNIQNRFVDYINLPSSKQKSNSLDVMILKYGTEVGTLKYKEKNSKCSQTLDNFVKRHGLVEGEMKYKKCNSSKLNTRDNFIKKYGEQNGIERYNNFCSKNKGNHSLSRKIEIHKNYDIALEKYLESRNKISKNNSLVGYIEKYGLEEGSKKFQQKIDNIRSKSNIDYYKNKYGDRYKEALKQRYDTNSLEFLIKKYGEIDGHIIYNKRVKESRYRSTLEWYIEKYGEFGELKFIKSRTSFNNGGFSKISQKLFDDLVKLSDNKIYYATKNKEFIVFNDGNCFLYDYVDNSNKKVIEFNGDIFHANPSIYLESDRPNPYRPDMTSLDIWNYDSFKNKAIIDRGYDLMVVWEYDYRINPDKILNECIKFLNYEKR